MEKTLPYINMIDKFICDFVIEFFFFFLIKINYGRITFPP